LSALWLNLKQISQFADIQADHLQGEV